MVTLEIYGVNRPSQHREMQEILGPYRVYRRGTDLQYLVDFHRREEAHLAMVNLNQLPGVKARIAGEPTDSQRVGPRKIEGVN